MDPNANLVELSDLAEHVHAIEDHCNADGTFTLEQQAALIDDAQRMADLIEALDRWIRGGGFLPRAWDLPRISHEARS